MAFTNTQQFKGLLEMAKNVLIAVPKGNDAELSTALAFSKIINICFNNIQTEIVCDRFSSNSKTDYLPDINKVHSKIQQTKSIAIDIDVENNVPEISSHINDSKLTINLKIEHLALSKEQITIREVAYPYDCIITIGAQDLESLGAIFTEHTSLFYSVPIINIDCKNGNEHFGTIQFINLIHTTTAESVISIFNELGLNAFDPDTATLLLANIIMTTDNFKKNHINPSLLHHTSNLLTMKADHTSIITNLYRTRTLTSLKLWGAVLSNIQKNPIYPFAWVRISKETFLLSHTDERELLAIADELILNSPEIDALALIFEDPHKEHAPVRILLTTTTQFDSRLLLSFCDGEKTPRRSLCNFYNNTINEVIENIIPKLHKALDEQTKK